MGVKAHMDLCFTFVSGCLIDRKQCACAASANAGIFWNINGLQAEIYIQEISVNDRLKSS
jgi:hypothetical protein